MKMFESAFRISRKDLGCVFEGCRFARKLRENRDFSLRRVTVRTHELCVSDSNALPGVRLRLAVSIPVKTENRFRSVSNWTSKWSGRAWRYLVDPASSHMLVSKIKPCMSKYEP